MTSALAAMPNPLQQVERACPLPGDVPSPSPTPLTSTFSATVIFAEQAAGLKGAADAGPCESARASSRSSPRAAQQDTAAGRRLEAGEAVDQRRLAGAVWGR